MKRLNAKQKQLAKDRIDLKEACEQFASVGDNVTKRAQKRGAVERIALAGTRFGIAADTEAERNEFAAIVTELAANRGIIATRGIESAVNFIATIKLGYDRPALPPEVLKRLDALL